MADIHKNIVYHIDSDGLICEVNEAWDEFAEENAAAHLKKPFVSGKSLWSMISDPFTREVYRQVVKAVCRNETFVFSFRCDSRDISRLIEMTISPSIRWSVQFSTCVLEEVLRDPVVPSGAPIVRDESYVRACSWCNRIYSNGHWVNIDVGIRELGLFTDLSERQITHGVCIDCRETLEAAIHAIRRQ